MAMDDTILATFVRLLRERERESFELWIWRAAALGNPFWGNGKRPSKEEKRAIFSSITDSFLFVVSSSPSYDVASHSHCTECPLQLTELIDGRGFAGRPVVDVAAAVPVKQGCARLPPPPASMCLGRTFPWLSVFPKRE
ncbi:hypothetical protein H6P81_014015 [Aristolochia fimbriata]|uniref:Uncharacterized protein n=1 Tax=Aristolochia fimbriata TaxID=158543 RepID=A0AAV7EJL6_ARIFI|nr:hypothetical protein H6P81_014015 [Aristolochia fimbriata]